ncbi:hypothetical protein CR513_57539, partial [Mucuna pruriens]
MIAKVLIENGSSLNVMPKATLDKLYLPSATLKNSPIVVKAFDGSKREVMGEITLPIRVGPKTFDVTFQVMDIRPVYICLLGGLWIHAARVVPCSLHQKVKFIMDGQLISIMGEKELIISTPFLVEYIEGEALETSFQALEIVGTANVEVEGGDPRLSRVAVMASKVLINNSFQPGKGLGKELHGIAELKERPGWRDHDKQLAWPDLYRYFTSGGIISLELIVVVEDQSPELAEWVYPTARELDN